MSIRDKIRSKTIGKKVEIREIEYEFEGDKIVFKAPTLGVRREIISRSATEDGGIDSVALQAWSVIYLTFDEEGEAIFDETDYEGFLGQTSGGFVDEFSTYTMDLMGNGKVEKEG